MTSILSASENTFKSITAVFGEKMAIFDDINVANVLSSNDFDFDIIGKEPTALYIIVPDEDKTYYTLVTVIIGLLYRELVKLANLTEKKKISVQIDWILDEFANCPPLPDIESIVSVARSRGMRFHFFVQSFSQLDNVYGKEVSQIILDNAGLIYLKTNTQDAKFLTNDTQIPCNHHLYTHKYSLTPQSMWTHTCAREHPHTHMHTHTHWIQEKDIKS